MKLTTSDKGIKLIAQREGEVLHGYKDSKNLLTVGVGHLVKPGEPYKFNQPITREESRRLLKLDLQEAEDAVNSAVTVPLKQHQFDALVSLTFNIGVGGFKKSSVVRRLNAGDTVGAAKAILLWNKPPEIQRRRHTEYEQFLTPYPEFLAASAIPVIPAVEIPVAPDVSSQSPSEQSPPVEVKTTKVDENKKTEITTIVGNSPSAPAVQVSQGKWFSRILAGFGGASGVITAVWGWAGGHLDAIGIGLICLTLLILALIFRSAILDAIRMQSAADPNKYNVK